MLSPVQSGLSFEVNKGAGEEEAVGNDPTLVLCPFFFRRNLSTELLLGMVDTVPGSGPRRLGHRVIGLGCMPLPLTAGLEAIGQASISVFVFLVLVRRAGP